MEVFHFVIRVELLDSLVDVLVALHLTGDVEELLGEVATLIADLAPNVALIDAKKELVDQRLLVRALESLLYGVKEDAIELMNVLLLATLALPPPEGPGQVFGGAAAPVGTLKLDKESLDLEEHFAPTAPHVVGGVVERDLRQGQAVDGRPEGRVHEQVLHSRVHVACCSPI